MRAPAAGCSVPFGVVLDRVAAEQQRLAALSSDLEQMLGSRPGIAGVMNTQERQALQQLDYLRQALECLSHVLRSLPPEGDVDLSVVTRGMALQDIAARLQGAGTEAPARDAGIDFFG